MRIIDKLVASDGTIKYGLLCDSGERVEACVLFFDHANTKEANICISCQVGCRMVCDFCISGHRKFIRNLNKDEIITEFIVISEDILDIIRGMNINLTYMGSGEPFDNLSSVLSSAFEIRRLYQNITRTNISTILLGTAVNINEFRLFPNKLHLQFSLHATDDNIRRRLFRQELPTITDSLKIISEIAEIVGDKFCINYVLFDKINDTEIDARKLISYAKRYNCYVKLSEYAEIEDSILKRSTRQQEFYQRLIMGGVEVRQFVSRGVEVNAACGNFYRNCSL